MSSGFISGGTNEKPIERDDDWLKAQPDIEASRQQKLETRDSSKSLYEVLQQNKGISSKQYLCYGEKIGHRKLTS